MLIIIIEYGCFKNDGDEKINKNFDGYAWLRWAGIC